MAVRRKPPVREPTRVGLGYVVLNYTDLCALIELLASKCEQVEILARESQLSQLSDIYRAARADRKDLRIETYAPRSTIDLTPLEASITTPDGASGDNQLVEEVVALLAPKRKRLPFGRLARALYFSIPLVGLWLVVMVSVALDANWRALAVLAIVGGVMIGCTLPIWAEANRLGAARVALGDPPDDIETAPLPATSQPQMRTAPEDNETLPVGFVRLYLDDIEDVRRILAERSSGAVIFAGGAQVDSVNDLRNTTSKELADVVVGSSAPGVIVRVGAYGASVVATERTADAIGLAEDTARLLRRRATTLPVGQPLLLILFGLLVGIVTTAPMALSGNVGIFDRIGIIFIASLAPLLGISLYVVAKDKGSARIYRTDRAGRADIMRSWIQFALGIVLSAVTSALLTWWQLHG